MRDLFIRDQVGIEGLTKFLSELADERDTLALSYIADIVTHFLAKSENGPRMVGW